MNSKLELSSTQSDIGKRISVLRCDKGTNHKGTNKRITRSQKFEFLSAEITNFCKRKNRYTIRFDCDGTEEHVSLFEEDFRWIPEVKKCMEKEETVLGSKKRDENENKVQPQVSGIKVTKRTLGTNVHDDSENYALVGKRFVYTTSKGKQKYYTVIDFDTKARNHYVRCNGSTKLRVVDFKTIRNCRWLDFENKSENVKKEETCDEEIKSSPEGKSLYHGVHWSMHRELYIATYSCAEKRARQKIIGAFSDAKHAALAFDHEYRKQSHSEGDLNFPHEYVTEEQLKQWNSNVHNHDCSRVAKPKLSQYRGVCSKSNYQKTWIAQVSNKSMLSELGIDDGPYEIGLYETEIQAALAFDRLCRKHGVDEMGLNFPRSYPLSELRLFDASCHYCHKKVADHPVATKCNHVFCYSCILNCLNKDERCPCCHTQMRVGEKTIRYVILKDYGNGGNYCNTVIDAVRTNLDSKNSLSIDHYLPMYLKTSNTDDGSKLKEYKSKDLKECTSLNQYTNLVSPEGSTISGTRASEKRKMNQDFSAATCTDSSEKSQNQFPLNIKNKKVRKYSELNIVQDEADPAKEDIYTYIKNNKENKRINVTFLDDNAKLENACVMPNRKYHNTRASTQILESFSSDAKNICTIKRRCSEKGRFTLDNRNKRYPEKSTDVIDISLLKKGDRTAFDFGNRIYFGSIQNTIKQGKDKGEWRWVVVFDDGEVYELDYKEMTAGASLYQQIKEKELSDPLRTEKLKKLRDDHIKEKKKILSKMPDNVKDQFLEIGFALWRGSYRPVLFLGPYHISPGIIRNNWHQAFYKLLDGKSKIEHILVPRIVYWFGQMRLDNAFSIVKGKDCITFDEGWRKGLKSKQEKTKPWQLMEEALGKPKNQRNPIQKSREEYEYVLGPKADRLLVELETEWKDRGWK